MCTGTHGERKGNVSDPRIELQRSMARLLASQTEVERAEAAQGMRGAVDAFLIQAPHVPTANMGTLSPRDQEVLAAHGSRLRELSDRDLDGLNELLPWAAMTAAPEGRIFGRAWTATKRATLNALVDSRIVAFNAKLALKGMHVLEAGCFEGIHTIGCAVLGARVTGFDGRIENLVKTMARVWAYEQTCQVFLWNVEKAPPPDLPVEWDVLHHVGVLYHLSNPVEHLNVVLPRTRRGVLLDTHVATSESEATLRMEVGRATYRYVRQSEVHRDVSPFAGLEDHAKWLHLDDLTDLLKRHGFTDVQCTSDRVERNGRRVTIFAFRGDS